LRFDPKANRELTITDGEGQSADSKSGLLESSVTVSSYDWGAWGKLKITAILDDNTEVVAHLKDKPDVKSLSIPKDDNGNKIADAWEDTLDGDSSTKEDADEDNDPDTGSGHIGDGLSVYEEYRGFRIQGGHQRLNPSQKDVFIRNRAQLPTDMFELSGLTKHEIAKNEYALDDSTTPNPAYVNFNTSGYAHLTNVHVLRLINRNLSGPLSGLGTELGATGDLKNGQLPGPPKGVKGGWVRVDAAACLGLGKDVGPAELVSTVAHELAHGCNVWHHGGGDYPILAGCMQFLGERLPQDQWATLKSVSVRGGQNSGDPMCIMKYEGSDLTEAADAKEEAASSFSWKKSGSIRNGLLVCSGPTFHGEKYGALEPPGNEFCDTPVGRPFPKAGDATPGKGDCQHQFDVNDKH